MIFYQWWFGFLLSDTVLGINIRSEGLQLCNSKFLSFLNSSKITKCNRYGKNGMIVSHVIQK